METTADTEAPSTDAPVVEAQRAPLDTLLVAFQRLQMQNAHVSSLVASTLGISATDLRALLFIGSGEGVTPKRTGDFLELTSGAITNLVDRMEAAALVRRAPHPVDRRSIMLELAPGGVDALQRVVDFYRRAFGSSVAPEHFALMATTFGAIGDAMEQIASAEMTTELE
jgi:DNA-binding MarR family transcriptional regulator